LLDVLETEQHLVFGQGLRPSAKPTSLQFLDAGGPTGGALLPLFPQRGAGMPMLLICDHEWPTDKV
jgi:hypothetical protein